MARQRLGADRRCDGDRRHGRLRPRGRRAAPAALARGRMASRSRARGRRRGHSARAAAVRLRAAVPPPAGQRDVAAPLPRLGLRHRLRWSVGRRCLDDRDDAGRLRGAPRRSACTDPPSRSPDRRGIRVRARRDSFSRPRVSTRASGSLRFTAGSTAPRAWPALPRPPPRPSLSLLSSRSLCEPTRGIRHLARASTRLGRTRVPASGWRADDAPRKLSVAELGRRVRDECNGRNARRAGSSSR